MREMEIASPPRHRQPSKGAITVRGARQNNLKGLDVDLPLRELIVVTGVSGSGKSSLAFDTVYAEGQRRYVETFSPYARQFLDRMDRPRADRIDGIPPAVAVDQTNQVRTSRSTVGTMTEINDYLKLLYARLARLHCRGCGQVVRRDTPESIADRLIGEASGERAVVRFRVRVPDGLPEEEVRQHLARQGYTRVARAGDGDGTPAGPREGPAEEAGTPGPKPGAETEAEPVELEVTQDRLRIGVEGRARLVEALEAALTAGRGRAEAAVGDGPDTVRRFSSALECPRCDIAYRDPVPNLFSFNSPIGACDTCRGFGREMGIDYDLVIPDGRRSLREGAIKPLQTKTYLPYQRHLLRQAERAGVPDDVPWRDLTPEQRTWVVEGDGRRREDRWFGLHGFFNWLERKSYRMHIRVLLSRYRGYLPCTGCGGARLKPEALDWRLAEDEAGSSHLPRGDERSPSPGSAFPGGPRGASAPKGETGADDPEGGIGLAGPDGPDGPEDGQGPDGAERPGTAGDRSHAGGPPVLTSGPGGLDIHELCTLPLDRCLAFFEELHPSAPADEATTFLLEELRSRLRYLVDVGLGYLTLDRQSRTLSGGEVQRINLTTALGTSLVNTLFVLDEPSVGLHPRDLARMIGVLHRLRDAGNTILVVEHDEQVIRAADRVLDLGPGPGAAGGEIVYEGPPPGLARCGDSLTGAYLGGRRRVASGSGEPPRPPAPGGRHLLVRGAAEHNLKGIDVRVPLGRLVCVTGVSGSGKSTLVEEVCHRGLLKQLGRPRETPGRHEGIDGAEAIADVVLVDQSPIGKTSRSVPASYVGALDAIRKLFAAEPLARERGYTAGRFSFNHADGRCPTCSGNGFEHLEMQFLSDVYLRCPDCDGRRFRADVLEVKIAPDGLSIAEVLDLTVDQAIARFADSPEIVRKLAPLAAVGLGYVTLGQPVPSLSGGEAQRLKLAGHLAGPSRGKGTARRPAGAEPGGGTLFLFDEPTTGLHFDDVATLLAAFRELIAAGDSVVVIEHHLDVIAAADWIVDLGPEGGDGGGEIVCEGPPAAVAAEPRSHTGRELRAYFARWEEPGGATAGQAAAATGDGHGG